MLRNIITFGFILVFFVFGGTKSDCEPEVEKIIPSSEAAVTEVAPYLLVTKYANIRLNPNTNSTIVAKAVVGDVFKLSNISGEWFKIYMFSGEARYIHKSVAHETNIAPSLPSFANKACQEIVSAQDRATREAMQKYPNDILKKIDYERLLMDRYTMSVFHKYSLPPARYSKLALQCAKNM